MNDDIDFVNIETEFDLYFENDGIKIRKDWEYAWGIGRHDLPDIIINYSYQDLAKHLNDYGKKMLITPRKILDNKLFYGYIAGKYKIAALVRDIDDPIKITYWYENNKTPINWTGDIQDSIYQLIEKDHDDRSRATIELSFFEVNGKVRAFGQWKDLVKKKTLTIELFQY